MTTVYLLVLIFLGGGEPVPPAHVFAQTLTRESCERIAKDLNKTTPEGRKAVCVVWRERAD